MTTEAAFLYVSFTWHCALVGIGFIFFTGNPGILLPPIAAQEICDAQVLFTCCPPTGFFNQPVRYSLAFQRLQ